MGFIEEIKWWQWTLISLLVGTALAFANLTSGRVAEGRAITPEVFESRLSQTYVHDGKTYPFISNIRVYPALPVGTAGQPQFVNQVVTFTSLIFADRDGGHDRPEQCVMVAPVPYIPNGLPGWPKATYPGTTQYTGQDGDTIESICKAQYGVLTDQNQLAFRQANPRDFRAAKSRAAMVIVPGRIYNLPWDPAANHTIVDFLRDTADQGITVNFRYAWWAEPRYVWLLWLGGAFLIVGVLWPITMRLMIYDGLGDEEKAQAATAAKAEKELKKKEKEKEKMLLMRAPVAAAVAAPAARPVAPAGSKTGAGPAAPPRVELPKKPAGHYEGEFYPVIRPDEKK